MIVVKVFLAKAVLIGTHVIVGRVNVLTIIQILQNVGQVCCSYIILHRNITDCTEDVGLPTKSRFNVGPESQPIAGSMPVNRLRRWLSTNPSLGLLYTLRKDVAFTQCCFNVDPQSLTLVRY